jgi:hypothetical protein
VTFSFPQGQGMAMKLAASSFSRMQRCLWVGLPEDAGERAVWHLCMDGLRRDSVGHVSRWSKHKGEEFCRNQ